MTEQTLAMWDASSLPDPQPTTPVAAMYAGGDTPHDVTDAQLAAIRARWGVIIWTGYDHTNDGALEAGTFINWLHRHKWTPGTIVALDTEELVIPDFITAFNAAVTLAGWLLMNYRSKSAIPGDPPTSGGGWAADWTGIPHLRPGDTATQYVPDKWLGAPYDLSLIRADVPLHELNPPVIHHVRYVDVVMRVPVLGVGDEGPAVRRLQSLLEAWYRASTGPGGADGIFGPDTLSALVGFQRAHGITPATGAADGPTWARLVEG